MDLVSPRPTRPCTTPVDLAVYCARLCRRRCPRHLRFDPFLLSGLAVCHPTAGGPVFSTSRRAPDDAPRDTDATRVDRGRRYVLLTAVTAMLPTIQYMYFAVSTGRPPRVGPNVLGVKSYRFPAMRTPSMHGVVAPARRADDSIRDHALMIATEPSLYTNGFRVERPYIAICGVGRV